MSPRVLLSINHSSGLFSGFGWYRCSISVTIEEDSQAIVEGYFDEHIRVSTDHLHTSIQDDVDNSSMSDVD